MQEMTHRHTKELDIFYREHREACTNCGKKFHDGMCAHVGYVRGNNPAVLCDDCAEEMIETVVRYHWMAQEYESPNGNSSLWRYMDLAKFIQLIASKTLFFAPADSFDDPFEGAKGIVSRKGEWDDFYIDFFRKAIATVPEVDAKNLTKDEIEVNAKRLLSELNMSGEYDRKHTFISCWHENEFESEAMWKLYSANYRNAVAVKTTAAHLYEALGKDPRIDIGRVKYIDFNKRFSSINGPYWYKRKSFEYEREVRAVMKISSSDSNTNSVPVDIEKLIDQVYISPYAPLWFEEVVTSVMLRYDVNKPVFHSTMKDQPFY